MATVDLLFDEAFVCLSTDEATTCHSDLIVAIACHVVDVWKVDACFLDCLGTSCDRAFDQATVSLYDLVVGVNAYHGAIGCHKQCLEDRLYSVCEGPLAIVQSITDGQE